MTDLCFSVCLYMRQVVLVAVLFADSNNLNSVVTALDISVKCNLFTPGSFLVVLCTVLNCSNIYC